jgi:catechol 2,3-dioxygenase-like lactoylglutathione lyase family enzyme
MAGTGQHIPGVGTVYLAVSDHDRALEFYRDKLGFEVRTDTDFGEGFRWVEVAPVGAYTVVALVLPANEQDPKPGGQAPFGFDTPNLEAAMAEFRSRGVEFEDVRGSEEAGPPMAYFRDPDGNRILLVEETSR